MTLSMKEKKGGNETSLLSEEVKNKIELEIQKEIARSLKDLHIKKDDLTKEEIKKKELFDRLELEALLNLNFIDTSDYKTNQQYFKDHVLGDNSNADIIRMWLMHLLGGGVLADHFINKDGSLKQKVTIENEIVRLTSWRGTATNDYWLHQRIVKMLKSTSLKSAYAFSFIKQIYKFIESWIFYTTSIKNKKAGLMKVASLGTTFLVLSNGYLDNLSFLKHLRKIKGFSLLLDQINYEQTSSILSKALNGLVSFGGLVSLFSAIIAFYESFYYQIERDQINKYLKEGIDESTKTKMFLFKDILGKYDSEINHQATLTNEEILNSLNKYYVKNKTESGWFRSSNSYSTQVYEFLSKSLDLENRKEFYQQFRKKIPIIPYAIYFFNQKGEPRTVRETICAIIVGLNHLDNKTYKELRDFNIVSEKRQKNLMSKGGAKKSQKICHNLKKKKNSTLIAKKTPKIMMTPRKKNKIGSRLTQRKK